METLKTSKVLVDKEPKHDDLAERAKYTHVVHIDIDSPHGINQYSSNYYGPQPVVNNCQYC